MGDGRTGFPEYRHLRHPVGSCVSAFTHKVPRCLVDRGTPCCLSDKHRRRFSSCSSFTDLGSCRPFSGHLTIPPVSVKEVRCLRTSLLVRDYPGRGRGSYHRCVAPSVRTWRVGPVRGVRRPGLSPSSVLTTEPTPVRSGVRDTVLVPQVLTEIPLDQTPTPPMSPFDTREESSSPVPLFSDGSYLRKRGSTSKTLHPHGPTTSSHGRRRSHRPPLWPWLSSSPSPPGSTSRSVHPPVQWTVVTSVWGVLQPKETLYRAAQG